MKKASRNKSSKNKSSRNNKPFIHVVNLSRPEKPAKINDEDLRTEYVPFGIKNDLIDKFAERYRKSQTHRSAIRAKARYTLGGGIVTKDKKLEGYFKDINANGESINDILRKSLIDWYMGANPYIEIVKVDKSVFIYQKDTTFFRVGKRSKKGIVDQYYYCEEWRKVNSAKDKRVTAYKAFPNFGPIDGAKGQRCILHIKDYEPGMTYYGMPDYMAAYSNGWIDIDYLIPRFNRARFDNKFIPSGILFVNDDIGAEDAKKLTKEIEEKYQSEDNNSRILIVGGGDGEKKSNYVPLNDVDSGTFMDLQEMATKEITKAHSIHPKLAGIETAGKLGGADNASLRTEYELLTTNVLEDVRKIYKRALNKILGEAGFKAPEWEFKSKMPITFLGDISISSIIEGDDELKKMAIDKIKEDVF